MELRKRFIWVKCNEVDNIPLLQYMANMGHGKGKKHSGRGSGRSRGAFRSRGRGRGGGRGGKRGGSLLPGFIDEADLDSYYDDDRSGLLSVQPNRVKLNKKLKVSRLKQINDMVDLNRGNFTNIEEMSLNSMMYHQSNMRRKRDNDKSMYSEVRYTNSHREDIFNKSYRKLSIEFVKAKEVYDPSKSLFEKLAKSNLTKTPTIVDIEEELIKENGAYQDLEEYSESETGNYLDLDAPSNEEISELSEPLGKKLCNDPVDLLVDESDRELNSRINEQSEILSDSNLLEEYEIISKVNSQTTTCTDPPLLKIEKLNNQQKRSKVVFVDDNAEKEFNVSYDEDESDDAGNSNEPSSDSKVPTSESDDYTEDNLILNQNECDNPNISPKEIQIGRYLGSMKTTSNGDNYIEFPIGKKNKKKKKSEEVIYMVSSDNDEFSVDDVVEHVNKKLYGSSGDKKIAEKNVLEEPEFGFLEEDYVSFDVTNIKIENLRVGANQSNQQFYVQAPYLFGFDEFQWLSREDFLNFLVENGFPEHRFDAFIRSTTAHLVHPHIQEREDNFEEDELFISDSSEGEEFSVSKLRESHESKNTLSRDDTDTELDEELMEGIEDLLTMHKSSQLSHFDPLDIGTKSIKSKGRKRNSGLEFNTDISPEFQKFLNDKYVLRKQNKKEKKEEREFARKNNAYMLTKYPYVLEMIEIIEEFNDFKEDPLRDSLRFPPLDFHVNMVLKMISEAFGYSSRKIGKGKKEYLEVRKPRKSKGREPDWDRIRKLAAKRKLCFRMDVQLSREEKRELKRVKGGNVEVEKMRNKGRGNFSYKEGEVVGANAKEIDASSIGRKLLEKMGWQAGDALGPHDNKGIMEPIKVVVKTSKRGL